MTNKSTKRALLTSVISMLICIVMLVGTTFAWFTDSVSSVNNVIKSGNLDVELYYQNDTVKTWTKVGADTNIFKTGTLWEPGHTEVVKLKVVNEGTLALKYRFGVNVASEVGSTNVYGDPFKLSEHIYFGVVDSADEYTRDTAIAAVEDGAKAIATGYTKDGNLKGVKDGEKSESVVTLVVYMPTTVGNEANYAKDAAVPTIDLGLNVLATQYTSEYDSFNNQYDVFADYDGEISNAVSLAAAFKNGGTYKVTSEIALDSTMTVAEGVTVNLDLGGNTITSSVTAIENNGTMTIANGTLKNTTVNGGSVVVNNGKMVIDDATIVGAPLGETGYPAYALNNSGNMIIEEGTNVSSDRGAFVIKGNGSTTINGGVFTNNDIERTLTSHVVDLSDDATEHVLTINGGTFQHLYDETSGGVVICNRTKNTVYVNGGNFSGGNYFGYDNLSDYGYGGTFSVTGGTFTAKPADKYIADGYVVTENSGTYTVEKKVVPDGATLVSEGLYQDADGNYLITNATGFAAMGTKVAGETAYENDGTWILYTDIDMSGVNWTPIAGFHGVLDGNGKTVSNLTASLFAKNSIGGSDYIKGGLPIIKDVTFDKANITGTEYVGIVVGDAVGVTLENVKVTNSTVIGTKYVGGLVGRVYTATSTITGCSVSDSTIKAEGANADGKVGGIAGFFAVGTATGNSVTNCTISGPECVGGIVGRAGSGDTQAVVYGNTVSGNTVTGTETATVGDVIGDKLNVKENA